MEFKIWVGVNKCDIVKYDAFPSKHLALGNQYTFQKHVVIEMWMRPLQFVDTNTNSGLLGSVQAMCYMNLHVHVYLKSFWNVWIYFW